MASIKQGSGRSSVSRQAQQDYHNKEQALVKKHQRELRRVQADHQAKISDLSEQHDNRMDKFRSQSREEMQKRDFKYQKEIQEMRDLHREQLRKLAETNENNLQTLDRTRKNEFNKMQNISERQKSLLRSQHRSDVEHMQSRFNKYIDTTRKEQIEAKERINQKLSNANAEKLDNVINNYSKKLAAEQENHETYRREKETQVADLKQSLVEQKNSMSQQNLDKIRQEQVNQENRLKERQVSFDNSLKKSKQKFANAIREEKEISERHRNLLSETVQGRYNETTKNLERRIGELKLSNSVGFQNLKKQYETEKNNIIFDYEQKNKFMESAREQALEDFNRVGSQDRVKVRQEFDEKFRANNTFHLRKFDELERRHAEKLENLIQDTEQKQNLMVRNSEKRLEAVNVKNESERREREDYFKNAILQAKLGFQEQLRDQRIQHASEKQDLVKRFKEQLAKSENAQTDKHLRKVAHYEKRIEDINDRHLKEMRSVSKQHQRLLRQEERASQIEKDTLKSQYQDKVEQVHSSHKEEIERLHRVHQEELQRLAIATRKD